MKPLIPLSDLLNQSWEIFKKNWQPLVKILLWGLIVIPVIGAAFALFIVDPRFWPTFVLAWIVALAIQIWVQVKFIQATIAIVDKKPLSNALFKDTWSKVPAMFGWSLLWGLVLMLAIIPFGIPFIWLTVLWSNANLRLVEGKKPYARGSSELVHGRWWATAGRHVIPFLILSGLLSGVQIVSFIVIAFFSIVGLLLSGTAGASATNFWSAFGVTIGYIIMMVAQTGLSFAFAPFQMIYHVKLYRSLEQTKN